VNPIAKFIFFFLVLPANTICVSQTVRSPISSGYLGLGAYSNNHLDVFSIQENQAALAKMKSASAGVYGEKRFMQKELGFYDAALALPTHSGNFGLDARYFGFADYNEMQLSLAYARSLGKIDIGIQFNNYSIRVAGYGNASTINFDIGTLVHLTDKLNAGIHVYNPLRSKLGKNEEEQLASSYSGGIGYEASEKFFLSLEIIKEEDRPVNVNAGLQYKFFPWVLARVGMTSAASAMFFGVGIGWRSMRLDATASIHQQLGITPGLMLVVPLSRNAGSKKEND